MNSPAINIAKTREDELREQVNSYHRQHPEVWDLFCAFTREVIRAGHKNYSANAIFERIRWERDIGGNEGDAFKLNNNYRAFYARRFMTINPQFEGFFRTRKQISADARATDLPQLTPSYFNREEETYGR